MIIQANNKDIILFECNIHKYNFDTVDNVCESIGKVADGLQIIMVPEGLITNVHVIKKGYMYE